MDASYLSIAEQILLFRETVEHNKTLMTVLQRAATMKRPGWYVASGAVSQTVWNVVTHRDPEQGINDYDLVYFDASDLSWEAEDIVIQAGREIFADIPVEVEIRNQARVHLWYEKKFGKPCPQYKSSEAAISAWGMNSALIAIRLMDDGQWNIFAPWGFSDIFRLTVRPNGRNMTKEVYDKKVGRWRKFWPELTVFPWS
ncbi:Fc.00g055040.m01.CDS01 [Cosmosporella sp. VM-42]